MIKSIFRYNVRPLLIFKSTNMPLGYKKFPKPMQDGRRKLDPTLHPEIIRKYKTGLYSWNSLGKEYGVSKRLIGLIVNPAAKKREQQRNKERWHAPDSDEKDAGQEKDSRPGL